MPLVQTSQVVTNAHVMMDIPVMATAVPMSMNVKLMSAHQMPPVPIPLADMNAPVTLVMKVTVPNAVQSITVKLEATTVMLMLHAVLMDQISAVHVTLDSAVMVPAVLITMNVPMVVPSVMSMPLAIITMVDTHVAVTVDMKVMANNVPTSMNVLIVHVTPTHHAATPMVDSPAHVMMDSVVTAHLVPTSTNAKVLTAVTPMPPVPTSLVPTLVLVTMVTAVMETHVPMLTNVLMDPTTAQITPAVQTIWVVLSVPVTKVSLAMVLTVPVTNAVTTIHVTLTLIAQTLLEDLNVHADKDTLATDTLAVMSTSVTVLTHVMLTPPVTITLVDIAVNVMLVSLVTVKHVMTSMSAMAPLVTLMLNVTTLLVVTNASVTMVLLMIMAMVQSALISMNVFKPMLVIPMLPART